MTTRREDRKTRFLDPEFVQLMDDPICEPLTKEEQIDHGRRYQDGDREAGERLAMSLTRYVVRIAARKSGGVPDNMIQDVVSLGMLGLCTALNRYDPEKGFCFSTYATPWIYQQILRHKYELNHHMAAPYRVQANAEKMYQADEEPIGKSCEALALAIRRKKLMPIFEEATQPTNHEEEDLDRMIDVKFAVMSVLSSITDDRDRDILVRRIINGETLRDAGERHGISKERVRQIFNNCMSRLHTLKRNGMITVPA